MTLIQLHYAITISETGSMNKASEILYVSQPSLTSAVKDLENEIGISIFNRTGRGMTLTNDGSEFIKYAKMVFGQYQNLLEKYGENGTIKKKFGVSTQHYSFAVKAFVETVKNFDAKLYEFSISETKTREVVNDVAAGKSEIGVLYLSSFNRRTITTLFKNASLKFHKLIDCPACVYIWKNHPLANETSITYEQLKGYPCISFDQGDNVSLYFAEEILPEKEWPFTIKANDRASVLNLMVGLNGFTLCSGIICEELNGSDYVSVPFEPDSGNESATMEIGYIVKENTVPSRMCELYIQELKKYLGVA